MVKEVKRFETVAEYEKTEKRFKKDKARMADNQKWFEKRFGEAGGSVDLPDGTMGISTKEPNGKDSPAYKAMLEELEAKILSGELYHMNKEDAAVFMLFIRANHTKPQMAGQKIEVKAEAVAEVTESRSQAGLVKIVGFHHGKRGEAIIER